MLNFTKKYQVWESDDDEFTTEDLKYSVTEFDNLQEAVLVPKKKVSFITKKVSLAVTEAETEPYVRSATIDGLYPRGGEDIKLVGTATGIKPNTVERSSEEIAADELAAKYAGGPIADIS